MAAILLRLLPHMWTDIIRSLGNREEWVSWKEGSVERRVRREGNLFCLYDVDWEARTVAYCGCGSTYDAIRFAARGREDCYFFSGIQPFTPFADHGKWRRLNERKIRKRLFFNRVQPRLYSLKVLDGGKKESSPSVERIYPIAK